MEITIQLPETLGQQLQPFRDRLPELIERGLRDILAERQVEFKDENEIMELLISQPRPEQVLAVKPSPEFQARVSDLLQRNKQGQLSAGESAELERHLMLEHLVRLAKAYAYKQLTV
ncbi:MAG: hypothetical protein KDJ65_09415 [Anaerolineae bacterium]|nr:hypothetical protein [Anaerolineae bacterium]